MVSLTTQNSHSGGFFGFSEDHLNTNSDDDLIVDHIELVSSPHVLYKPIRTTWAIVLNIFLYLCLCASAFLVPYFCPNSKCAEDDISLVMYIHGGIWFLLLGLDRYLLAKHNQSRLNGYLQFYRKTKNIRRLPFMINSCANAVVVVLFNGLDRHFHFKDDPKYLQILVAVESGIAFIFLIIYFGERNNCAKFQLDLRLGVQTFYQTDRQMYTVIFNHSKAPPDVTQEEIMTSFVNSQCYSELGYKNENYIDQVLEKQADMIRYLRQHSETLAKRNLVLQEDLKILRNSRSERKK